MSALKRLFAIAALAACMLSHPAASAADVPAQILTPTLLLDWAEKAYPRLFPGGGKWSGSYYRRQPATQYSDGYLYRYYGGTGNYLGFLGEDIYLLGPASDGQLSRLGTASDLACRVNRAVCSNPGPEDGPLFIRDILNGEIVVLRHRNPRAGSAVPASAFSLRGSFTERLHYDQANDRLFVLTIQEVFVIDGASKATGAPAMRRIVPANQRWIHDSHYDKARDLLFVLVEPNNGGGSNSRRIDVFERASQLDGPVTPNRSIKLARNWFYFTIDSVRSIAYVGDHYSVAQVRNIYSADGEVKETTPFLMRGSGLAIDSAKDRLYTRNDEYLYVLDSASTTVKTESSTFGTLKVPAAQTISFDEAADRLYFASYTEFYVLNRASTIRTGTVWQDYGVKVIGAPNMAFQGFAFP